MFPGTRFEIIDNSHIPELPQNVENRPLFLCAFSSDKGEEGLQIVDSGFIKKFGEVSFYRHGQAILQADKIVNSGGKILAKRIVATDATLANIIILAKIKGKEIQKTDSQGKPLYKHHSTGEETIEATDTLGGSTPNTPIMLKAVDIKYEAVTVDNIKSRGEVDVKTVTLVKHETQDSEGYNVYPLFSITDNGRGLSNKKFRISPDYEGSKSTTFVRYKFDVLENNKVLESMMFGIDPEKVYFGRAYSLDAVVNNSSLQVKAKVYPDNVNNFVKMVKDNTDLPDDIADIMNEDILFGTYKSSKNIPTITVTDDSVNLSSPFGISLASGGNGNFGERAIMSTHLKEELVKFFNGEIDDMIYDHVKYPIEAIIDANYPEEVKRAIENFVIFREDIMFFEDLGFVNTMEEMKAVMYPGAKTRYCTFGHLNYDTIDPYTKKQIHVTNGFALARILPNHFRTGRSRPLAGILNEAVITEAIEGTVNYIPKVTPVVNQKQELDDWRICYAGYYDNKLVLETQYTSQDLHTQLSYVNNVLAIQEVIRAVRNRCPATRYSFIDGEDLETYKSDVQAVLNKYVSNFKILDFEYIQDDIMVQNKIFYAAIRVAFRDYVQAEWFKIYAINVSSEKKK